MRLILILLSIFTCTASASQFPQSSCSGTPYWLEVSAIKLCLEPENVSYLNVLNSKYTSMSIVYDGREYIFQVQTVENATGGLHKKYGLSAYRYFLALALKNNLKVDYPIAYEIHELKSEHEINVYESSEWAVFTLISNHRSFDEVFIINKKSQSIFQIGGEFDQKTIMSLLSKVKLP
ncbi:hypothetical protein L1077_14320 [Pseudoalteromonas luteoviolacea]|uniref:hypothetical protein n=1 Tax=Pseudoalteromonas luteoviolacea TaxID=43657 RepID=UPI001F4012CA|nr:hypothetical protein [Pseudoalteromonas luteoviolacea]MCF6440610.1 hypothetical protein [Pseudoalteromonas luteoviolacea]